MPILHALTAAAVLLVGMPGFANADPLPGRWISTWAAPPAARVDQSTQTLSAAAQAFPWARDVPASVRDAAPGQALAVGGGSPLHFRDQTLRQVAHVSVGGARVRVVLANTFGTLMNRGVEGAAVVIAAVVDRCAELAVGLAKVAIGVELAEELGLRDGMHLKHGERLVIRVDEGLGRQIVFRRTVT